MSSIVGDLTIETTKLKAQLASARNELKRFKSDAEREGAGLGQAFFKSFESSGVKGALMGVLGGGTILGAAEALKGLAEEYAHLYDLARRFDVSTDSMQRLSVMAKRTGADVGGLVNDMQRLARSLENTGDEKVRRALEELKMSPGELIGADPEKQIQILSEAFNKAQKEGRGFASVFDLMGKSAGEMIPLLRDYAEHAQAASEIELVKEAELKKMKEAIESFDLLITKAKGYAVMAMMSPQQFIEDHPKLSATMTAGMSEAAHLPWQMYHQAKQMFGLEENPDDAAETASQTAKKKAEETDNSHLRGAIDRREIQMRDPINKGKYYLDEFAKAAGIKSENIGSATQMRDILRAMKADAEKQHKSGDLKGEHNTLTKLNDAQSAAQALAGMDSTAARVPMGSLGGDINRLLGKSGSELVSDKIAEGNTVLGRIESLLRQQRTTTVTSAQSMWLGSNGAVFGQ